MRRSLSLLLLLAAACAAPSGEEPRQDEPPAIRPQPIPEPGFAFAFDRESLRLTEEGADLLVRGVMTGAIAGKVTAFDATSTDQAPIVTDLAESGEFALRLTGAKATDRIHLSFDADPQNQIALVAHEEGGKVVVETGCVTLGLGRGVELPPTEVGVSKRLELSLSADCAQPIDVDQVRVLGDAVVVPNSPFRLEASTSLEVSWTVAPPRAGVFNSFVVFFEGDARHVVTVRGRAD